MSLTRPPAPFPFIQGLLANAIVKRAATQSVAAAHAQATREYNRSLYIIKVLQAPYVIRRAVRAEAAVSDSVGQIQLAGILTIFEALSPQKQIDFIDAYKGASTVRQQGAVKVAVATAYQPGHIPPQFVP